MNVAALRQHIRPTERIHGIFTKGGDKANIVPAEAVMDVDRPLGDHRLAAAAEAARAAVASRRCVGLLGARCTTTWHGHTYADMIDNGPMVAAYVANAARVGRTVRRSCS